MHKCKDICEKIEEYIEGDLSKKELRAVEEHLKKCPSCREEFEFAKSIRKALKEAKLPEPPNDFMERVNQRLDKEIRRKVLLNRLLSFKTCSTVAACVLIAVFLGLNEDDKLIKKVNEDKINVISVETTALPTAEPTEIPAEEFVAEEVAVTENIPAEDVIADNADLAAEVQQPAEEVIPPVEEAPTPAPTPAAKAKKTAVPTEKAVRDNKKESTPKPFSTPATTPTGEVSAEQAKEAAEEKVEAVTPEIAAFTVEEEDTTAVAESRSAQRSSSSVSSTSKSSGGGSASGGGSVTSGGGASGGGGGGGSSGGASRSAVVGKVYVPSQYIGTASGIASGYGSVEGGAYKMSAANYQKFLSALRNKGIQCSPEAAVSGGTYRFQIVAQ